MTDEEKEIVHKLGEVWNLFIKLPELNNVDNHDFMHAVHSAQNIVLSRMAVRELLPYSEKLSDFDK